MQIYSINRSATVSKRSEEIKGNPPRKGFAEHLQAKVAETRVRPASIKDNLINLGKVTKGRPTVSHLLADHSDYGRECWDIIHSGQNYDKPYTRIPVGTTIFLDPVTRELSWDKKSNFDSAPNQPEPVSLSGCYAKSTFPSRPLVSDERELIQQAVHSAASQHDLSSDLIFSVIRAESGFNVQAVSKAGAQGLMQLMPETARELGVERPFDIFENIDAGARYLKKMLGLFGGNLEKALAAYNAGPGTVMRFNGHVPYEETRQYVVRVMSFLEGSPGEA